MDLAEGIRALERRVAIAGAELAEIRAAQGARIQPVIQAKLAEARRSALLVIRASS